MKSIYLQLYNFFALLLKHCPPPLGASLSRYSQTINKVIMFVQRQHVRIENVFFANDTAGES